MAKRRPGAQPHNKNAWKHGFFSGALSPEAQEVFKHALKVDLTDIRNETALMRTALYQLAKIDPDNVELLSLIASRLTRMVAIQYGMSKEQQQELHASFVDLVDDLKRGVFDPDQDEEGAA